MPENLFLSPSLLADSRTLTWINERRHVLYPHTSSPADPTIPTSEYRKNFLPVYFGRKTRLQNPLSPFSGVTCSLKVYKPTGVHPVPPLQPKDPKFKDLLTVEGLKPSAPPPASPPPPSLDTKTLLRRLYLRSEYRDNFASISARNRQVQEHVAFITRCQSAPGGPRSQKRASIPQS